MARDRVLTLWQSNLPVVPKSRREAILRTPAGMDRARVEALLRERDNRPMTLGE